MPQLSRPGAGKVSPVPGTFPARATCGADGVGLAHHGSSNLRAVLLGTGDRAQPTQVARANHRHPAATAERESHTRSTATGSEGPRPASGLQEFPARVKLFRPRDATVGHDSFFLSGAGGPRAAGR